MSCSVLGGGGDGQGLDEAMLVVTSGGKWKLDVCGKTVGKMFRMAVRS